MTNVQTHLVCETLELLKEILPKLTRVTVLQGLGEWLENPGGDLAR